MTNPYSEDTLVERPAIALFRQLGWETANCFDEVFGTIGGDVPAERLYGDGATVGVVNIITRSPLKQGRRAEAFGRAAGYGTAEGALYGSTANAVFGMHAVLHGYDADGYREALATISAFHPWLLAATGAGLLCFGLYQICHARYAKIAIA